MSNHDRSNHDRITLSSREPVVSWSHGRETRALATGRLQIKPSGSGEENGRIMSENPGVYIAMKSAKKSNEWFLYNASHGRLVCVYF